MIASRSLVHNKRKARFWRAILVFSAGMGLLTLLASYFLGVSIGKEIVVDGISFRFKRRIICFRFPWADARFCVPFTLMPPFPVRGRQYLGLGINVLWLPPDEKLAQALAKEVDRPDPSVEGGQLLFARVLPVGSGRREMDFYREQREFAKVSPETLKTPEDLTGKGEAAQRTPTSFTPAVMAGEEAHGSWYRYLERMEQNEVAGTDVLVFSTSTFVAKLTILSYPVFAEQEAITLLEEVRVLRPGRPPRWLLESLAGAQEKQGAKP